jgi:cytochrome c-type biogenesis protein CcmH/NrfG
MKPLEAIFWLGTACVLYRTADKIVKNVTRDILKAATEKDRHSHGCE